MNPGIEAVLPNIKCLPRAADNSDDHATTFALCLLPMVGPKFPVEICVFVKSWVFQPVETQEYVSLVVLESAVRCLGVLEGL